jgi:hypothetical protein
MKIYLILFIVICGIANAEWRPALDIEIDALSSDEDIRKAVEGEIGLVERKFPGKHFGELHLRGFSNAYVDIFRNTKRQFPHQLDVWYIPNNNSFRQKCQLLYNGPGWAVKEIEICDMNWNLLFTIKTFNNGFHRFKADWNNQITHQKIMNAKYFRFIYTDAYFKRLDK